MAHTASQLQERAARLGVSSQEFFNNAIENIHHIFDKYEKTGIYPVRNPRTGEVEYKELSSDELKEQVSRELEQIVDEDWNQ